MPMIRSKKTRSRQAALAAAARHTPEEVPARRVALRVSQAVDALNCILDTPAEEDLARLEAAVAELKDSLGNEEDASTVLVEKDMEWIESKVHNLKGKDLR